MKRTPSEGEKTIEHYFYAFRKNQNLPDNASLKHLDIEVDEDYSDNKGKGVKVKITLDNGTLVWAGVEHFPVEVRRTNANVTAAVKKIFDDLFNDLVLAGFANIINSANQYNQQRQTAQN